MGWLFMTSLSGHSGPRQYLDAQFTYECEERSSRVLRSALVGFHVYYAAVEQIRAADKKREVWAVVCLVKYNPRDREGYIFGYKDMDESVGPFHCDCPQAILELLTPTDRPHAVDWRARCRAALETRRTTREKPTPRPGQTIVFDDPISFSDGATHARLQVIAHPSRPRTLLFRAAENGQLYRIRNFKTRAYQLFDAPTPSA